MLHQITCKTPLVRKYKNDTAEHSNFLPAWCAIIVSGVVVCNWPGLVELPGPTEVVSPSGRTSSNLSDSIGAKYPSTLSVSSSKARNSQQQYMYPVLIFLTGGRLLS